MQKRISTLPFQGTKEQQEQLFKVIDENGGTHGSVMPILQKKFMAICRLKCKP